MPCWLEFDRVTMPLVRALHQVWEEKRAGRVLPCRGDFDPVDLKRLMPNLMIVEIEPDPFRLRYRLVGTTVVRVSAFDFTGQYLDEIVYPYLSDDWHAYYRLAYERRCPVYGAINSRTRDGDLYTYEFGIFPVSLDGSDTVGQCLSLEDYGGREPYFDEMSLPRRR